MITILVKWIKEHSKTYLPFETNPVLYLIRYYNKEAVKVREMIDSLLGRHNFKYFRNHTIIKDSKILARSINNITYVEDAKE